MGGSLDSNELLLGVNRDVGLSEDFVPDTVPVPDGYRTKTVHLRAVAAGYFVQLSDAAVDATGRKLRVGSGYRSFCTQCSLFANYASNFGEDEADTFSARAGHSEHQLGLTTDIFNESNGFLGGTYDITGVTSADPEIYRWLDDNAWRFGFMNSYPPNDADNGDRFASRTFEVTRYIPEPWHWRFVGKRAAELHQELKQHVGFRLSTHEFVDLLREPSGEHGEILLALMEEKDLSLEELEVEHPDDAAAIELATSDLTCHSQTLGRAVHHGDCVQVERADCGVSSCAWWACVGGAWVCAAEDSCTSESFEHSACTAE